MMGIVSKTTAKSFFEKGDRPTEAEFADLIDSSVFIPSAGAVGVIEIESTASATNRAIGTFGVTMLASGSTASAQGHLGFESIGAVGAQVLSAIVTASAQDHLGLGTAALLDAGVSANNVPQMDTTGYPAADGSQITGLSRGYIDGLILSNNGTDGIDISAGIARDDGDAVNMSLAAALTNKLLSSVWAVGASAGMLDTGAEAATTWYYIWVIRRSDTGVVDVLASLSATAPTMPTNYDQKRRIGAILTNATPDIIAFRQYGERFMWDVPVSDYSVANPGVAATLRALTVPRINGVRALLSASYTHESPGAEYLLITHPDQTATAPSGVAFTLETDFGSATVRAGVTVFGEFVVNGSAQIRTEVTYSAAADTSIKGITHGWIDPRGRNA